MPSARPVSSPPVIADINLNAQGATLRDAKQRLTCSRTSCRDKIALLDISLGDYAIERRNHSFETLQLLEACNVGLIGRSTGLGRGDIRIGRGYVGNPRVVVLNRLIHNLLRNCTLLSKG